MSQYSIKRNSSALTNGSASRIIAFTFCSMMLVIWLIPLVFSILNSFKTEKEIFVNGYSFFPQEFTFNNYLDVFKQKTTPIVRWFWNSLFISGIHTILVLLVASTSAFAYARLKFKGRDFIFWALMATMMFPEIINLVPRYKVCSWLGLINTPWAIILPGVSGVFNIFLIKQFMSGIPKELDEAATIDGANKLQILSQIIIPSCIPVLTVVAMFSFTGSWNEFLWSSLVINNVDKMPMTPGVRLLQGTYGANPAHALAGSMLSVVPTFVFFLFAQKYFLKGMQLQSGVKG